MRSHAWLISCGTTGAASTDTMPRTGSGPNSFSAPKHPERIKQDPESVLESSWIMHRRGQSGFRRRFHAAGTAVLPRSKTGAIQSADDGPVFFADCSDGASLQPKSLFLTS